MFSKPSPQKPLLGAFCEVRCIKHLITQGQTPASLMAEDEGEITASLSLAIGEMGQQLLIRCCSLKDIILYIGSLPAPDNLQ